MNISERVGELINQVGRPYTMYNANGSAQGCAYPILFVYDNLPDFFVDLKSDTLIDDVKPLLDKYFVEIPKEELKIGDILVLTIHKQLHFAIYYEFGKMISVFRGGKLTLHRFNNLWGCKCYRIK